MQARRDSGVARYSGDVRLWQGPNVVQAPNISFDRDHRSMVAGSMVVESLEGGNPPASLVTTALVQSGTDTKNTLVTITSRNLTYTDSERRIHFEGVVTMHTTDATITSQVLDVYLAQSKQATSNQILTQQSATPSRLERAVAKGNVAIVQPTRRATGETLTYVAAEDKFTLEGGSPSIFDAERGQITGDSLTFFRHDDRVLVEGGANSPVITKTRVAH
jgi:lipopolysaccharide export system protein LptA